MIPTLAEFLAWLEQTPRCIPTLPDQSDLQPAELIPVWNPNHEVQSGFGIVYDPDGGTIHTIAGNRCSFDVSDAGQTWTRFFGLLQTTARNVGFHGTLLLRPYTHRIPGSYNQPPQLMGSANLHGLTVPTTGSARFAPPPSVLFYSTLSPQTTRFISGCDTIANIGKLYANHYNN
jgi:hypothetical protein